MSQINENATSGASSSDVVAINIKDEIPSPRKGSSENIKLLSSFYVQYQTTYFSQNCLMNFLVRILFKLPALLELSTLINS